MLLQTSLSISQLCQNVEKKTVNMCMKSIIYKYRNKVIVQLTKSVCTEIETITSDLYRKIAVSSIGSPNRLHYMSNVFFKSQLSSQVQDLAYVGQS